MFVVEIFSNGFPLDKLKVQSEMKAYETAWSQKDFWQGEGYNNVEVTINGREVE